MNAIKRMAFSAAALLAACGSASVNSLPSDYDLNNRYWSKEHTDSGTPYVSIGSNNNHGVGPYLAVPIGNDCSQPEVRILEMDDKDFAGVSTDHKAAIQGAKFRVDKGTIYSYEGQGDEGGSGGYTYTKGIFIFMSRHTIESENFFSEFVIGKTMYYTDDSLDKTYHFSLNGSAAAFAWFIQECKRFKANNGKNDEADIWGEDTKVKRPDYDGPEWES